MTSYLTISSDNTKESIVPDLSSCQQPTKPLYLQTNSRKWQLLVPLIIKKQYAI